MDGKVARIPTAPHSIAEELWRVVFWQDNFLRWAREDLAYPSVQI